MQVLTDAINGSLRGKFTELIKDYLKEAELSNELFCSMEIVKWSVDTDGSFQLLMWDRINKTLRRVSLSPAGVTAELDKYPTSSALLTANGTR